jgi:hypothetical protein
MYAFSYALKYFKLLFLGFGLAIGAEGFGGPPHFGAR